MHQSYITLTFDQIEKLPDEAKSTITKYGVQLTPNTLTGPISSVETDLDNSNYYNHSCNPNTLPLDENHWIAISDIQKDDEITVDYVTFDCNPYSTIETCLCGSTECRGTLTQNDYVMGNLQEKYRGHFVSFIQKKIDDMNASSFNGIR